MLLTLLMAVTATALCLAGGAFYVVASWLLALDRKRVTNPKVFAFFHPHASGGGGGERVLWKLIQNLQRHDSKSGNEDDDDDDNDNGIHVVIYTLDPPGQDEAALRADAEQRFDVKIDRPVQLISLQQYQKYLEPKPFLSLLWESYATMQLAMQAIKAYAHFDVFVDSTGCAFSFLVVRWTTLRMSQRQQRMTGNSRELPWIVAYVHYPTISTDMMSWELKKLQQSSPSLLKRINTTIKLIYYRFFAILYGLVGSLADVVMVNSTWTYNHIAGLWEFRGRPRSGGANAIQIVYPPCRVPSTIDETSSHTHKPTHEKRQPLIVSIAQFRPEKNHILQIEALAVLLDKHPELRKPQLNSLDEVKVKLLLIGSCRNDADRGRVEELRQLVKEKSLDAFVEFNIDPPFSELQDAMKHASIGIHTMREEHFGIGIVEMMAAGLLVVAHDSGGPKTDIVTVGNKATGFRATTADEYADAIYMALEGMTNDEKEAMREGAQASATRFSDDSFDESMQQRVLPLFFQ